MPQYALPDLTNMGRTWVYGITKYRNCVYEGEDAHAENWENENDRQTYNQSSSVLGNSNTRLNFIVENLQFLNYYKKY